MSTRSLIGIEANDGTVRGIYCHFDGYVLGGVGEMLAKHWTDPAKVEQLVALGQISRLGEEIGEKHDFDFASKFYDKYKPEGQTFGTDYDAMRADPEYQRLYRMTNVYGRDRGETGTETCAYASPQEFFNDAPGPVVYLFRKGAWVHAAADREQAEWYVLAEVLA